MRFDIEDQVCQAQAFTGALTVSANSRQKQTAVQDLSIGRRMAMWVLPTVAAGSGSSTKFEVIQADNTALTSNKEVIATLDGVLAADLELGDEVEIPIPQGVMSKVHIGIQVTITGGTTTLTCDVYFVPQDEIVKYKSFPKVVNAET